MSKEKLPICIGCGEEIPTEWMDKVPRKFCNACDRQLSEDEQVGEY